MTFEKYNANPENKNIGDCSIRAICTATPLTYQQAKKLLETKDVLKEAGCKWASKKKLWYWHAGEWVKKVRRTLTMNQIRDLHGSEFLQYRPETPLLQ